MGAQAETVTVVGGGLAGAEAAWQLASRGTNVRLMEMRPSVMSPAHRTGDLGELVCSNSLKGTDENSAAGLLKRELRQMGSLLLEIATETRVPAGGALAVDRDAFSAEVTRRLSLHPQIEVVRGEVSRLPEGRCIIATGPLTSDGFVPALDELLGGERLAFFDAAAPIVEAQTLDRTAIFAASRYDKGDGADYLNAPMERDEYEAFISALVEADRVTAKDFERKELFTACQPVEEVARSGMDALRFGALKPVGLTDPRTQRRPWAVVQLRAENAGRTAYNLVGFQTNLTFAEQRRVFRMIPGMQSVEFLRYGVMHRNTFVDAPRLLDATLRLRREPRVRLAGQLTGTEGYLEAVGSGLLAGLNAYAEIAGLEPFILPRTSALGSLVAYATDSATQDYQPMHVNFGLVPAFEEPVRGKRDRYAAYSRRAIADFDRYLDARADLALGGGAG